MIGGRRGFLRVAMTASGATSATVVARAPESPLGQPHQEVPSDLALRVKSLESPHADQGTRPVDAGVDEDDERERDPADLRFVHSMTCAAMPAVASDDGALSSSP